MPSLIRDGITGLIQLLVFGFLNVLQSRAKLVKTLERHQASLILVLSSFGQFCSRPSCVYFVNLNKPVTSCNFARKIGYREIISQKNSLDYPNHTITLI